MRFGFTSSLLIIGPLLGGLTACQNSLPLGDNAAIHQDQTGLNSEQAYDMALAYAKHSSLYKGRPDARIYHRKTYAESYCGGCQTYAFDVFYGLSDEAYRIFVSIQDGKANEVRSRKKIK